jgi:hypothetical protein
MMADLLSEMERIRSINADRPGSGTVKMNLTIQPVLDPLYDKIEVRTVIVVVDFFIKSY